MIKAALFDVDGTLLDTRAFIFQAFQHVFEHYGEPYNAAKLTALMGQPLEEVYQGALSHYPVAEAAQRHRDFQQKHINLVKAFPDTIACLMTLQEQGIKTAAVTTRKRSGLASLQQTGVDQYLNGVITGDDVVNYKPHPEALLLALDRLGALASEAVMMGDSDVDIVAGKRAGTLTIGASYGFSNRLVLKKAQPDAIIDQLSDMIPLIPSW